MLGLLSGVNSVTFIDNSVLQANWDWNNAAGYTYMAQTFNYTNNGIINEIQARIYGHTNPATLYAFLFNTNGTTPTTYNCNLGSYSLNGVSGDKGLISFGTGKNCSILANTKYAIVLTTYTEATQQWAWNIDQTGDYVNGSAYHNTLNSSWTSTASYDYNFKIIGTISAVVPSLIFSNISLVNNTYFNTSSIQINTSVLNTSTNSNVNQTYYLYYNNGTFINSTQYATNNLNGTTTISGLTDNTYKVYFYAKNNETNVTSSNYTFTIDTTAPVISIIGSIVQNFQVNFSTIFNVTDSVGLSSCSINITYLENVTNASQYNKFINCTDTTLFYANGLYNGFILARDLANNTATLSINGTIQAVNYYSFYNNITHADVGVYSASVYFPNGIIETYTDITNPINLSPVYNGSLILGNYTIQFTKTGYLITNFTIPINITSGGQNLSYNVSPVTLYMRALDSDTSTPLTFDVTIIGSTIVTFTGLTNLSKMYSEVPNGNLQFVVTSSGYSQAVYYNTLSPYSNLVFDVYMTPVNDSSVITFNVKDFDTGLQLGGVLVEARLIINDTRTTIQQSITSDNGLTYMYLNVLNDYEFIFSKDGYTLANVASIPTTTTYNVKLRSGVTTYSYINNVNFKLNPVKDLIVAPENITFSAFISGSSITFMNYTLISNNGTILDYQTSINPTGTTFETPYQFINSTNISTITMTIYYIVDGNTQTTSKTWRVIYLRSDEIDAFKNIGADTTEEIKLFKFFFMLIIFAATIITATRNEQARDYVSGILIMPVVFFTWAGWISLLYGSVLCIVLFILFMGANKR